jgi:flagellar protein FliO/FliZ
VQRIPSYLKIILFFILCYAVATPYTEIAVIAAPDNGSQSVDSYFNTKDRKSETENIDQTNNNSISDPDENETNDVGITLGDIFRMVFALLFVAGLLYGLLRVINKKNRGYQHGQTIENLGGTPLGGNRSVQMVRIGEKIYILGVGDSVQLLNVIDDKEEYSKLIEEHNQKLELQIAPMDVAVKLMNKWKVKSAKQTSHSFRSQFQEQLEQLKEERKKVTKEMSKKGTHRDE